MEDEKEFQEFNSNVQQNFQNIPTHLTNIADNFAKLFAMVTPVESSSAKEKPTEKVYLPLAMDKAVLT